MQRARSRPLLTRDSTMQPALDLELALADILTKSETPDLIDPCVSACLVAEFAPAGTMIVLFIVLFQKQTSYTFGEGTYSRSRSFLWTRPPRRTSMTDDPFCAQQTSKSCATCP